MWKQPLIFYSLINPSPDKERDSSREFADEGKGDVDDESDVELDGNYQLDSEHNDDDLESDLLSQSLIQKMELALQKNFSDPQLFQNRS